MEYLTAALIGYGLTIVFAMLIAAILPLLGMAVKRLHLDDEVMDLAIPTSNSMKEDEAIVFDFCAQMRRDKKVDDATYKAMLDKFGEQGIVDLIAVSGYYDLVAMTLNVAQVPLTAG